MNSVNHNSKNRFRYIDGHLTFTRVGQTKCCQLVMPTTKHCCYGLCKSDSRYYFKDYMKDVGFVPFVKPKADSDKCKRWVNACGRVGFTWKKVTKYTHIPTKHFMDPRGPTVKYPDPVPARYTENEVKKYMSRKRKPPARRTSDESKPARKVIRVDEQPHEIADYYPNVVEMEVEVRLDTTPEEVENVEETEEHKVNVGTQTEFFASVNMATKLETVVLKRENQQLRARNAFIEERLKVMDKAPLQPEEKESKTTPFCIESVKNDESRMKFYTGLTTLQFLALWNFLGPAASKLSYWKKPMKNQDKSPSKRRGPNRKLSPKNELFLTLIRLRLGLLHQDIAYRFDISVAQVSTIVITWVKFVFITFKQLMPIMLPTLKTLKKNLPPCFRMFKNTRCIIDCTEFFVQQATNFAKQGNLYSSYKSHPTYKVLIGICPNGAITFVSDVYEGSISDKQIIEDSKFLDLLDRGDIVMADRGFNVTDIMLEKGIILFKPPHLHQRNQLTPVEEAQTKMVAKLRIHVERAIERVKKYRLLQKVIPLSLEPIFSEIVYVCCCLVNFQEPLVK